MQPLGHNTYANIRGCCAPPFWGAGSPSNSKLPSDILIHPAVWPQQTWAENWGLCPFLAGRGAGSRLTQCRHQTVSPGLSPTSIPSGILIHPAIWPQQIWAKNWGLCPCGGGGGGFLSNTVLPGLRPTCMPSFILIHPTVWPQYTNVTDRQDRQQSDSVANGQRKLASVVPSLFINPNCISSTLV